MRKLGVRVLSSPHRFSALTLANGGGIVPTICVFRPTYHVLPKDTRKMGCVSLSELVTNTFAHTLYLLVTNTTFAVLCRNGF